MKKIRLNPQRRARLKNQREFLFNGKILPSMILTGEVRKTDKNKPREIIYEEAIARMKALEAKHNKADGFKIFSGGEIDQKCTCPYLKRPSRWKQFINYIKEILTDIIKP